MRIKMLIAGFVLAVFMSLIVGAACAQQDGVTGGLLAELPKLKDFKAGRQSSFDPSGGNADGRQDWPIKPGETREMAKIDGAGAITHIWVTISTGDKAHLKNLVLRMYWDGEESPSVESPIGDFFGLGHGEYYQYACLPIQIGTKNGLNCFWRMPFEKGARVTITNDGPEDCKAFYYYVDYQIFDRLSSDMGRFHAQYRQTYPCVPGQNYVFFEAQGRGAYVGCNLSIHNRANGWWGEGDDMIYIDGEEKPTFNGTGSEDYFCGAWCYGKAFSDLFLGCPLRGEHKCNELWNVYRYHLADPIPFTKSIKVTIEHGHANDRSDDFSSVGYWYQTEPHAAFPPLPAASDRIPSNVTPFVEEGAIEAEPFAAAIGSPEVSVQELGEGTTQWSDGAHLWFRPQAPTTFNLPNVSVSEAGSYRVQLWYTTARDYGLCEIWINDKKVAEWDGYNANGIGRKMIEFTTEIKAGSNQAELRVTGKNDSSSGFFAGIDCYRASKM